MIKIGSKVEVIGFGKKEHHNPKRCSYNLTGMRGTVLAIHEKLKGGLFSCVVKTKKKPEKGIYIEKFHFISVKLKEMS